VTGYGHLARHWPDLAALVDAALPSGGGARAIREELDARDVPDELAAADAAPVIREAIEGAGPGLTVIRVTEGAGKTRTAADVLRDRAEACAELERIPSGRKTLYVAPSHAVAAEVAVRLRGVRGVYLRGILAARLPDNTPACAYHVPLSRLSGARHAVQTWCDGLGMGSNGADAPCPRREGCEARELAEVSLGGEGTPAVMVTVHALLSQGLAWAGGDALVVIDEDPQAVEAVALSRGEIEAAASSEHLLARSERWRAPVLRALAAGLERGTIPTGERPLWEVVERGGEALLGDTGWCAASRDAYPAEDDAVTHPRDMLHAYAARAAWTSRTDEDGVTTWRRRAAWAPRLARAEHARVFAGGASERAVEASRVHALVARLAAGVVRAVPAEGVPGHAERGVAAVEVDPRDGSRRVLRGVMASPAVAAALHRYGPTVLLDATADVEMLGALAGGKVPVVDVRVADGAPVARRLLYWGDASRKTALDDGRVRWGEGVERYLRAALAHVVDGGARKVGVFSWKPLADALRGAVAGDVGADPIAAALVADLWLRGVTLVVGHYGNARGLDAWSDCDALVSLGDPRPNVGASRAVTAALGIAGNASEVYARATAAEVSQVSGRLRAPWRTAAATHVHVGMTAPASWDRRAEVIDLPRGVRLGADAAVVSDAVRVYGSARLGAAATGVSRRTAEDHTAGARKHLAASVLPTPQSNPVYTSKMGTPCGVGNTLETQRFVYPATDAAGLIEAAGGAVAVAGVLGVNRVTVYHWRAGRRPMPADAAQRLAGALAEQTPPAPATTPATPAATPLRFTAPPIPGDHDDA